ncbi:transducin beta-like protein 2 [Clavelina lepadiformis]|uniref:Transducin beta-like protein 2 n=1 Tax=Clavelina lepadiformis TaxID=159417 RepID=A0ABP0H1W1_CLALP
MDVQSNAPNVPVFAVTLAIGAVILLLYMLFGTSKKEEKENNSSVSEEIEKNGARTSSKKISKVHQKHIKKNTGHVFAHDLLHTSLKGHSGQVLGLDMSINGKYLASCSDDRTVRLWSVKDFGVGNRCVRVNVELDHARQARFSPDSRAFIAGLAMENTVRVYRLGKKDDGTTTCSPLEEDFEKSTSSDLLNIGVGASSSGGSFVMTAYKDTTILIRNLKGHILATINTNQGNNNYACVSPCGRFVACCGWTPDVKVWAVMFTRTGEFREVVRAFELKGHTSSVWTFAFNNDSTRMITVSKDGTWRFYDTQIEYDKGQEPYLLNSGEINVCGNPLLENYTFIALSPDARVAAVANINNIGVFSTRTGVKHVEFKEVHAELITAITFDIAGRYLLSTGDKHIRIFHNILGYKEKIIDLEAKQKNLPAASATKERYQKQITEAKQSLEAITKNT